jgi:hypothetical protein
MKTLASASRVVICSDSSSTPPNPASTGTSSWTSEAWTVRHQQLDE